MSVAFVVVVPHIVGNLEHWETVYSSDLKEHATRRAAIRHGWRLHGHDDWLLAHVRRGVLVGLSWQYEDRDDEDEQAEVARQLGLTFEAAS